MATGFVVVKASVKPGTAARVANTRPPRIPLREKANCASRATRASLAVLGPRWGASSPPPMLTLQSRRAQAVPQSEEGPESREGSGPCHSTGRQRPLGESTPRNAGTSSCRIRGGWCFLWPTAVPTDCGLVLYLFGAVGTLLHGSPTFDQAPAMLRSLLMRATAPMRPPEGHRDRCEGVRSAEAAAS